RLGRASHALQTLTPRVATVLQCYLSTRFLLRLQVLPAPLRGDDPCRAALWAELRLAHCCFVGLRDGSPWTALGCNRTAGVSGDVSDGSMVDRQYREAGLPGRSPRAARLGGLRPTRLGPAPAPGPRQRSPLRAGAA